MDSFRLDIQKALSEVLESITPANGYEFDMTPVVRAKDGAIVPCVYRGRNVFGEDDPDYCVTILEPPIPLESVVRQAENNTAESTTWELLIQGFVPDDKKHPTDQAQRFMEDVKHRLKQEKKRIVPNSHGDSDILGLRHKADTEGTPLLGAITLLTIGQGVCRPPDESSERAFFWLLIKLQVVEKEV